MHGEGDASTPPGHCGHPWVPSPRARWVLTEGSHLPAPPSMLSKLIEFREISSWQ